MHGAEREAEGIPVSDIAPDAHRRATRDATRLNWKHSNFAWTADGLFETRRLDERTQPFERGAAGQEEGDEIGRDKHTKSHALDACKFHTYGTWMVVLPEAVLPVEVLAVTRTVRVPDTE